MGFEITASEGFLDFLTETLKPEYSAALVTNLVYMPALEGLTLEGAERTPHSPQAPDGMVRVHIPEIDSYYSAAASEAVELASTSGNFKDHIQTALNDSIQFAAQQIVTDTPIDTGRAMNEWRVILADGTEEANSIAGPINPKSTWDVGGAGYEAAKVKKKAATKAKKGKPK